MFCAKVIKNHHFGMDSIIKFCEIVHFRNFFVSLSAKTGIIMKKNYLFTVGIALLLCACGHRTSSADLQHKLDSVKQLEERIRLEAQGIHLDATDPISLFLDSMEVMVLPVEGSSEETVINSSFRDVPDEAFVLMHILPPGKMKAVLLPDRGKIRLMLMSGDDDLNGGSVTYLYTFDMGYHVVDSLCLSRVHDLKAPQRGMKSTVNFAIMSNYQIILSKYVHALETGTPQLLGMRLVQIDQEGFFKARELSADHKVSQPVGNTLSSH